MMIDPKKAAQLIRQHFEELTTDQFVENIRDLSHEAIRDRDPKKQQKPRKLETLSTSEALSAEK